MALAFVAAAPTIGKRGWSPPKPPDRLMTPATPQREQECLMPRPASAHCAQACSTKPVILPDPLGLTAGRSSFTARRLS